MLCIYGYTVDRPLITGWMFKWVPYSQRYLVLRLVGLVGLVGFGLPTVTVRVSVMVSLRDSVKCA